MPIAANFFFNGNLSMHITCYSNVWPMFFQKSWWSRITQITGVMSAVVGLCVSVFFVLDSQTQLII